jgi:hypothetical protein
MPLSANTQARRYTQQLERHYLVEGRKIVDLLRSNSPRVRARETIQGTTRRNVILQSGIALAENDYLILPDIFLIEILKNFWDLYEMVLIDLKNPGATFMARSIYELAYRNLLQYVNARTDTKRVIAIKSWLCTSGALARSPSNPTGIDRRWADDYDAWLPKLRGHGSYEAFRKIKADNYNNADISYRMSKIYPKSFNDCAIRYADQLFKPNGEPLNEQVLIVILNYLNGHVHAQPAHISVLKNDYGELGTLGRLRTFLMFAGYEVMYLSNNQLPVSQQSSLRQQASYFNRIAPHVIRRVGQR